MHNHCQIHDWMKLGHGYAAIKIGKKEICREAGIDGNQTNHSLRASELFEAGVPETNGKDWIEITGGS